ncbi:MAG: hypothetical protein ACOQNV_00935 [Mycoplasmoidaceae bacterium]
MKRSYYSEIEGMVDFWDELGVTPNYDLNTDGVINGNLVEFKKLRHLDGGVPHHIAQLKRYLRAYNSAAKDIPSKSFLIYLNDGTYIEIDNETWEQKSGVWKNPKSFKEKFENNKFIKGWIDEYSIVAYNNRFCLEKPKATKEDVKNEFMNPTILPIHKFDWDKQIKTEEKQETIGWLHFNMNLLGNSLLKKQLGAFFTPDHCVKVSTEYIRNIIKSIGKKPYLIVDRCAGTGNLERYFNTEELKHLVVNTYDYTEWTTLKGLYDDRVMMIVPPTHEYRDEKGLLKNGDALSEEFDTFLRNFLNDWRKKNKNGVVIFLENPPFKADSGYLPKSGIVKSEVAENKTFIHKLMDSKGIKNAKYIQNRFIWSAFNLYLEKGDHYILYSPIKYWKLHHIMDKKIIAAYLSNRADYNTGAGGLPIIDWQNIDETNDSIVFENDNEITGVPFKIEKINKPVQELFDKIPASKSDDIIAYHSCTSTDIMFGNINAQWTNYKIKDDYKGFPIDKTNILYHCPIFCAGKFDRAHTIQWFEAEVIMKSADKGLAYYKDKEFLKQCFIFTILNIQNRCISSDTIKNQCAFGQKTKCDEILSTLILDDQDKKLLKRWQNVLEEAKNCEEYHKGWIYNYSQIENEMASKKVESGDYNKKGEPIMKPKYDELVDKIKYLADELKSYYCKKIMPKLYRYQLLK